MKPEHHKEVIMQAFIRCRRSYGSNDNGVAEFEKELDFLLAHYQACIAHNDMLLARLRMQSTEVLALRDALTEMVNIADLVDGWQSFPNEPLDKARLALAAMEKQL